MVQWHVHGQELRVQAGTHGCLAHTLIRQLGKMAANSDGPRQECFRAFRSAAAHAGSWFPRNSFKFSKSQIITSWCSSLLRPRAVEVPKKGTKLEFQL